MPKDIKLPDKIKIGHLNYSLTIEKDLVGSKGESLMGLHSYSTQIISLSDALASKEMVMDVLLHEILHGLWTLFNLPTKNEEQVITCLAPAIVMVLKDNPELRKYMCKALS